MTKITIPLPLSPQKRCSSCKRSLPLDCFTKCHFSYYAKCKECHARDKKVRYKEDSEYRAIQQKASIKTNAKRYATEEGRYKSILATQRHRAAGSLSIEQWFYILSIFNNSCAYCTNKDNLEQEHIVPVNKGGKTSLGNIVPACRRCNASKKDNDLFNWYPFTDYFSETRLDKLLAYMEVNNAAAK